MYISENMLRIIANERQQQFLQEAEADRARRLCQESKPKQVKLWQRLTWRVGGLMVIWGQRLQLRQEQKWV